MTGSNYSLSGVRAGAGSRGWYDECLTHHISRPDETCSVRYTSFGAHSNLYNT